jgi:ribonuclease D
MQQYKALYIDNERDLQNRIEQILNCKLISFDTEFVREKTYYPVLSLIQISCTKSDGSKAFFLIDCLVELDLSSIFSIISNQNLTKIFHSSIQDLQIFHHYSKQIPKNIYDTQIMSNFCGNDLNIGYADLTLLLCKKNIDKGLQRSDWQRRPLSEEQLDYAVLDVVYLEEIYLKLLEKINEKQRIKWYEEEMKNFIDTKIIEQNFDNLFRKFSFPKKCSAKEISQIKKMIIWREEKAKEFNLPRQHFLKDDVISEIILSKKNDKITDKAMKEEVNQIINSEDCDLSKKHNFFSLQKKNLYKEAKKLISNIAKEENFEENFLISSNLLKELIYQNKIVDQSISNWRYDLFGKNLEQLIYNQ